MKRLLLIVMATLAIAGTALAQDIYSVGNFTNSSGFQCAAVYLNDQKLYEKVPPLGDYDFDSPSLVVNGDDIYWAMNSVYATGGYNYGDIYKNGAVYFNSPGGQQFHINDLAYGDGHLYAGGSKLVEGSGLIGDVNRATIWMDSNTEPLYILGEAGHASSVTAIGYYGGYLISVGSESNGSGGSNGKIWLNGSQLHDYGSSVYPRDLALYDDEIYVLAKAYSNNPAGWTYKVYKGTQVLYTILGVNSDGEATSLCVDAGDVYVTGYSNGAVKVWKNGSVLCTVSNSSSGASLTSMANHRGIYHAGNLNGSAAIWHGNNDFTSIPSNCNVINDIYVEDHCINNDIWTLPFADSFETDYTPWICWINVDTDHDNGERLSYWHRCGSRVGQAATGEYFIRHEGHPTVNQTGWLVTPRLFLQPSRDYTTLSFKEMTGGSGFEAILSVRVSTNSDPNNANAYTQIWSSNSPNLTWQTRSIDLSAYQGKAIYVAFRFTGVDSWDWYVDDVEITEGWSPCTVPATVPFLDSFDEEINYCWYNLDMDYSGDNKCWQYSESNHYAVHPFGPQDVPQEGWLISRGVTLESGKEYELSFNSKSSQPNQGSGKRNSVWIALDEQGEPDIFHYTMIWEQTSGFTSDWNEISVPLTSYAGHNVRLAFVYEGNHGHNWAIDDISITEMNPQYTISVNANNNAWGTVSGGGTYNAGTSCTLTATPASGYQFQSWKKNGIVVSTNPNYTFTVTEDATYTAYFGEVQINYYTITTEANPTEGGTVTGGGTFQENSTVTLSATPTIGYYFNRWNDYYSDNPRTITVTGDATYTAYFWPISYTITVYANPTYGGNAVGSGTFLYGDEVTIIAYPASGYEFAGWDDGNIDNPRTIIVTDNAIFTAIFNETGTTYYTVTTSVNPEGAGTVTGSGTYPEATVIALIAEANPGYTFDHWSDGVAVSPRVITVNDNMSFTAYFTQNTYSITVNASPATGGIVEGDGSYVYGSTATLYAIPNGNYEFAGWSDGSSENPHYVTVTDNATYTAYFSEVGTTYYTVSTHVSPANAGTVTGAGTYEEGSSVTLEATANTGYGFSHWNDNVTQNPRTVTVNNNMSFTAYFTARQFTITTNANPAAGGTVSGGGTFYYGETAVLTATPNANYSFMQWSDGNTQNPRMVTVVDNATYTALFLTQGGQMFTLTVTSADPSLGTVVGSGTYPANASVEIGAYPISNAIFLRWNDGDTHNPRTVLVDSDMTFTAYFSNIQQYTIEVVSANTDMGSVSGGGTFNEGAQTVISALPFSGYTFKKWNDGNKENPRTITVTGNATYKAYFQKNDVESYTLTLICNTEEGSVSGGGVYAEGSSVTIQAFPKEGFEFDFWNDGNTDNPRTVTMTSDLTLVAFFKNTGVDETLQSAITVYPNPADESIRIDGLENACEVRIYNSLGELVKVITATSDQEIGINELSSGLYLLRCGNRSFQFVKK
jgi:hypothetical protein